MEYPSLKVPELRKILQERSLPTTGNKADLVARLQEDDKSKAPAAAQPAEDEIDYSDDEVTITTKAAEAKSAAAAAAAVAENPQADAPVQDAPAAPEGAAPAANGAETAEAPAAEPSKFALNLPATATDEEARKRADRAKRFGVAEDPDAKKKADRAQRFGIDESALARSLDSALPERALKRRGQGEEGKRQGRDGRRGRGGRQGRAGGPRNGGGVSKPPRAALDPAEKAKAEARAKRFGTA